MPLPDYSGNSIVNLMVSILENLGGENSIYPSLRQLDPALLRDANNIVLLVLDGLGYGYLNRVGPGGALHQHLVGRISSVFPPTTASAITTFLTGDAPQQHAVTGWFNYLKEVGSVVAVLPFAPRHGGPVLAKSGISAAKLFGHKPFFDKIDAQSYNLVPEKIANSEYNLAHTGKAQIKSYSSLRSFFANLKSILHKGGQKKYVHAYWPDLDSNAHEYGIGSQQAAVHFAELDMAFSHFLDEIKGTETLVIATADHGFIDSTPELCIQLQDHPELADTLVLPLCGERRAAYCYVHANKHQIFEDYVRHEFSQRITLLSCDEMLEEGYYGLGEPHPQLASRIGDYVLILKDNYTIKDWILGEEHRIHIGFHGGLSEDEIYVPLIVVQT